MLKLRSLFTMFVSPVTKQTLKLVILNLFASNLFYCSLDTVIHTYCYCDKYVKYSFYFCFPEQTRKLIEASHKAKSKAYCRYSKFRVGAALLCIDGTIVTGKNLMRNVLLTRLCWQHRLPLPPGDINSKNLACRPFYRRGRISLNLVKSRLIGDKSTKLSTMIEDNEFNKAGYGPTENSKMEMANYRLQLSQMCKTAAGVVIQASILLKWYVIILWLNRICVHPQYQRCRAFIKMASTCKDKNLKYMKFS